MRATPLASLAQVVETSWNVWATSPVKLPTWLANVGASFWMRRKTMNRRRPKKEAGKGER